MIGAMCAIFPPTGYFFVRFGQIVTSSDGKKIWQDAVGALREVTGTHILGEWNDAKERTREQVLAAFDKAIELAASHDYAELTVTNS